MQPATGSPFQLPGPWPVVLGLVLTGILLLFLRWHLLDIPLERDESAYAYLGKKILEGQIPYRDVYEMKPPLLFYSYAALVAIFGYSQEGLHWAALFLTFWNAVWVMAIGMRLLGRFYGFLAGICYVLLTSNPFACAILAESELVLMGFVLPGLYLLLHWDQRARADSADNGTPSHWWLFGSGLLITCGFLVKQSAVYFFGIPALVLLWSFWQKRPLDWGLLFRRGAWFTAGVLVPVVLSLALIAALGAWEDFYFWNIKYVQTYASGLDPTLWKTAFNLNFRMLSQHFELYWLLGVLGMLLLLLPVLKGRQRLLLLALLLFSFGAVAPGRRFYGHYWLQFFPALAILIAVAFYVLEKGLARTFPRFNFRPLLALLAAMVLALPMVRYSPVLLRGDLHKLLKDMFPGNPYVEDKVLADFLAPRLQPGDEIAVLGSEPQYYIYLDRNAPSRHFYMAFSMRPIPEATAWQQEALDSLEQKKPRFIVFNFVEYSWMPKPDSDMNLYENSYRYARTNYRPVAWADMLSLSETKYVLDEVSALQYQPTGQRFITVYERAEPEKPDTPAEQ